jgi:hypothetical protein
MRNCLITKFIDKYFPPTFRPLARYHYDITAKQSSLPLKDMDGFSPVVIDFGTGLNIVHGSKTRLLEYIKEKFPAHPQLQKRKMPIDQYGIFSPGSIVELSGQYLIDILPPECVLLCDDVPFILDDHILKALLMAFVQSGKQAIVTVSSYQLDRIKYLRGEKNVTWIDLDSYK